MFNRFTLRFALVIAFWAHDAAAQSSRFFGTESFEFNYPYAWGVIQRGDAFIVIQSTRDLSSDSPHEVALRRGAIIAALNGGVTHNQVRQVVVSRLYPAYRHVTTRTETWKAGSATTSTYGLTPIAGPTLSMTTVEMKKGTVMAMFLGDGTDQGVTALKQLIVNSLRSPGMSYQEQPPVQSGGQARTDLLGDWVSGALSMTLKENGTFRFVYGLSGYPMSGTWRVEGDVLCLDHTGGVRPGTRDRWRFSLQHRKLVAQDEDGTRFTYHRPGY